MLASGMDASVSSASASGNNAHASPATKITRTVAGTPLPTNSGMIENATSMRDINIATIIKMTCHCCSRSGTRGSPDVLNGVEQLIGEVHQLAAQPHRRERNREHRGQQLDAEGDGL